MWELDNKKGWALKNRCLWTVVLEKTLESPLNSKESKPVNPPGNQAWIFIGRTDVKAEAPILWPPDVKSWLTGKDPDAEKDWGQEEKGARENEMVGGITNSTNMSLSKLQEMVKDRKPRDAAVHWVAKHRTWVSAEQQQMCWSMSHQTSTITLNQQAREMTPWSTAELGKQLSLWKESTDRKPYPSHA